MAGTTKEVTVHVKGMGFSKPIGDEPVTFTYQLQVKGPDVTRGGTNGGSELTFTGYGLGSGKMSGTENVTISVGGSVCKLKVKFFLLFDMSRRILRQHTRSHIFHRDFCLICIKYLKDI